MYYIGIDIGSTYAKLAVLGHNKDIIMTRVLPTGWSSPKAAQQIRELLEREGYDFDKARVVATGYGRIAVPYAHKAVTEISCHAKGVTHIFAEERCTVIDIGGQDTKVISIEQGMVKDFIMNDKCSAGTGRFLEVMANTMGTDVLELCQLAEQGGGVSISSMCTVFAESEVISLMAAGESKENIAHALVSSITDKVKSLCSRSLTAGEGVYLTGGLCDCPYILENLSQKLGTRVQSNALGRFAGAVGAAVLAAGIK